MIKITFYNYLLWGLCILLISSCKKEPSIQPQIDYKVYKYRSKMIGDEYLLPTYFPENYDTSKRYPVLYILDGNTNFLIVAKKVKNAMKKNEIPPHIVVGIGYVNENKRHRDYTPIYVKNEGEGKVDDFFKFITTELIRVIENNFSADTGRLNRALTGHSYGGIATLYGMFYYQDYFSKFIIGSPSLWYGDNIFFKYEKEYYETNKDLSAKVYMGMGGFEEGWMEPLFLEFTERIKERNYPSLNIYTKMYPKKDHTSVFPIQMEEGVRYVLK
jgi:predicted alpha/beta superfamily hydrolase